MKLKRMLFLAVAVVTLVCVMTLSAFALDDLTGISSLNGTITGLDFDSNSYQITPILMKEDKAYALAADKWTAFTADDNTGLSGLYKIRTVNGSTATSNAFLVYVDPTLADKQGLGSRYVAATSDKENAIYSVGYDNTMGNKWAPGRFSSAYINVRNVNEGTENSYINITHNDSHKWSPYTFTDFTYTQTATDSKMIAFMPHSASTTWFNFYPNPAYLIQMTKDEEITFEIGGLTASYNSEKKTFTLKAGSLTKEEYLEAVEKFSVKYAYKGTEVIKTKDFNSFSYAVNKRPTSSINIGATKTKVRFYVYNANANAIEVFEAKDEDVLTSTNLDTYTDHTVTASDAKLVTVSNGVETVTDTTMESLDASWDETPRYIIGYELFPAVDADVNNMTFTEETPQLGGNKYNGFNSRVYNGKYDIDLPKVAVLDDIEHNTRTNTLLNLDANTTAKYFIVQLEMNDNGGEMQGVDGTRKNLTTDSNGTADLTAQGITAGLWGVGINGDDYKVDSNLKTIYVQGTVSTRQNITLNETTNGYPIIPLPDYIKKDWTRGYWTNISHQEKVDLANKWYAVRHKNVALNVTLSDGSTFNIATDLTNYANLPTYEEEVHEATSLQLKMKDALAHYSVKYELLPEEVIPAKSFEKFKYGTNVVQGSVIYGPSKKADGTPNRRTKLVLYSLQPDGTIKQYSAFDDVLLNANYGGSSVNNHGSAETVHTYYASDFAGLANDEGYLVGIEIFPCIVEDATSIRWGRYVSSSAAVNAYMAIKLYYGDYKFDVEKASINPDISYDPFINTISGLTDTTKKYYLATYTLNGANTDINGDGIFYDVQLTGDMYGKCTLPASAPVGLLAVIAKGDEIYADSAPVIFYVPSAKAGHFNSILNGAAMVAEDTTAPDYYGKVGAFTYDSNSITAAAAIAFDKSGKAITYTVRPYFHSTAGFCYTISQRKYIKTDYTWTGSDGKSYPVYEEGEFFKDGRALDKLAFYYGFESDEIFNIQDFKGINLSNATLLQGSSDRFGIICDAGTEGAVETSEGSGVWYRVMNGYVNKGASFRSHLTFYYLDLNDGEIKSYVVKSNEIKSTTAALSFNPDADISNLNGYVLGFSIKPYQDIELGDNENIFSVTLNFGGRAYWTIGETAAGETITNFTNTMKVGSHIYDFPYDVKLEDGTFATIEGDTSYYQYAPVTFAGGDNLSATIGDYNATPFQLSDAANTVTDSGLYVLRRTNEDASLVSYASNIVYFSNSTDAEKQNLANITTTAGYAVPTPKTMWQQGYWRDDNVNYIYKLDLGNFYALTNSGPQVTCFGGDKEDSGCTADILYKKPSKEAVENAQNTVMSQVNALSLKYAYTDGEIIPAKDFVSFTYQTCLRMGNIRLAEEGSTDNRNTKIVVYVANPDKTVTAYEKYITESTIAIGASVDKPSKKLVVTSRDLLNAENQPLGDSNGYVIGVEIYPTIITDPTEIYATEPTYKPNGATIPSYYNTNFRVDIVYGDYKFIHSPDAPTISMVEGDTLTIDDYNALYDYQYKEGDGDWTELQAKSIRVTSPATEYSVRIVEGDNSHASKNVATVTSHDFIENGTSLILGGEIGIKTLFEVAEGKTLDVKCYDKDGTEITPVMSADGKSIIIYVPAKDRADGFKYSYTYNDTTVERNILTVADYISFAKSEYANDENALTLVNAIDSYTTQADIYFDEEATIVNYGDVATIQNATDIPAASYTPNDSNFDYRGAALILEGKTAIRHYFELADGKEGYTATVGDKELDIQKDTDNEVYYVDIADIGAKDIGTAYTVTIKNGDATTTITYSVLNYLKNKNEANTKIGNLARAMYDYYKAAQAYKPAN